MTTYLVTLPGVVHEPPAADDLSHLNELLTPYDPRGEQFTAKDEDLFLRWLEGSTHFALTLLVEAGSEAEAREQAKRAAVSALLDDGYSALRATINEDEAIARAQD